MSLVCLILGSSSQHAPSPTRSVRQTRNHTIGIFHLQNHEPNMPLLPLPIAYLPSAKLGTNEGPSLC